MDELVPELLSLLFCEGNEIIANAIPLISYFSIIVLTNYKQENIWIININKRILIY